MLELDWIEQALWDMKQGHRKMSDYTLKQRHALYTFRSGRGRAAHPSPAQKGEANGSNSLQRTTR
jgi:hypothetical protein